ncbi:hypothetical protein KCP70_20990 [Salmonella enterica subsp. enterica]|nr:hypothetical protein KCP70_20990 [Salmonella enterica subsp. enterica]
MNILEDKDVTLTKLSSGRRLLEALLLILTSCRLVDGGLVGALTFRPVGRKTTA